MNDIPRLAAWGSYAPCAERGWELLSLRIPQPGLGLRVGFREDESSVKGRSVDALALRGDEGRSTLR